MAFFGEGFTRTESGISLENGVYQAKIVDVQGKETDYGKHLEIKLEVNGQPQTYPNTFRIYARPTEPMTSKAGKTFSAEQRQHMWDAEQTKFFDSFQIPTTDNPFKNFKAWIGKTGFVTVQPQKSNSDYKEIIPYQKSVKQEEPKPAPAAPTTENNSFDEDIPF